VGAIFPERKGPLGDFDIVWREIYYFERGCPEVDDIYAGY